MIDLIEQIKKIVADHEAAPKATVADYLDELSKIPYEERESPDAKNFVKGLDIGFNYALAMMQEEFGDGWWKQHERKRRLVRYYSALVNLDDSKKLK